MDQNNPQQGWQQPPADPNLQYGPPSQQNPWGQPQGGQQPPPQQQGWQQPPPQQGWQQQPQQQGWQQQPQQGWQQQDPNAAAREKLEKDAMTWLIVGAVGFMLGFGLITGPLGWWQGGKVCNQYRAMGMEPSGTANAAKWIGIIVTALCALVFLAVFSFVFFVMMLGVGAAAF